ncbi:MAG: DUF29 domain-containing protein [Alphaproteobacteria bacterium]|nr:DUF29 domain-containing protein [Alphaproteobacteria bacterium]
MAYKPRALREDRARLYDSDFYAWTQEQAGLLRRARAERINTDLDLENLAEEIESLGKEQAHALQSSYRVLLIHLLKWVYQARKRSAGWRSTIVRERINIEERLEDNPGLKPQLAALYARAYRAARRQAAAETGLPLKTFPETCPFALDDACRDGFLPK